MKEIIIKYFNFLKSYWGKHYFLWTFVFLIFIILITYIQIPISNNYARILLIGALIFYFFFGHFFALTSLNMVKRLFTRIINLNNYSYRDKTPVRKLPALLVVLPLYLIIFQIYFIVADYSFIEALLFGWFVLIFVRSSHYVDKKLGAEIGKIIGSFFIPFGFIIALIKGASFYIDVSTNNTFNEEHIGYILYFFVILFATIPLEVLMDYKSKNKQKDEKYKGKRKEWENEPSFIKYKNI